MVKIASVVLLAIGAGVASAQGCQNRCFVNQAQSGSTSCVYNCSSDTAHSSQENAANFAGAMRQNGHQCGSNAGTVTCKKTPAFGECGSHFWKTGRGC